MSGDLSILFVEDDPDIRTIIALALALDPGIVARPADSGPEALALLNDGLRPDAIMLDRMLSGSNGFDVLRDLRCIAGCDAIPVVFLTAMARACDIAACMERGAAGVIVKPFDPARLADRIRALLEDR